MHKRIRTTTGALAALAALGLGVAAIATATGSSPTKAPTTLTAPEATNHPDRDKIQSGDRNTPDAASASRASAPTSRDTTDSASEGTASESGTSETPTASDGPGGHADEPGNPNANTEQQGQN